MGQGGRLKTSNTVETKVKAKVNTAETKVNTADIRFNTVGTKANTVDKKANSAEKKVNTVDTKANSSETKVHSAKTKVTTAETKFKTIPTLLLLLLTIFTVRANATITYLKFSDQKSQPIDQAGTKSILLLLSESFTKTFKFAGYQLCKLG